MLRLENVYGGYGPIVALRSISLHVAPGEFVALVGVNGAGKSTMLATIAGLLRPTAGTIEFEGRSLVGLAAEEIVRQGIALVPENRHIFANLTVAENLRLGAAIRRDGAAIRRDMDKMCSLFPVLGKRLRQAGGTLSGGEQQQLAIARALMARPRLLLLDEPSLGLAPIMVDEIFELTAGLHNSGVTILLVEQNVERTLAMVDRVYLLNTGQIEFMGTPAALRAQVDIAGTYLGTAYGFPH